eukprot:6181720-Pleurochrysis_carterae.AAC.2
MAWYARSTFLKLLLEVVVRDEQRRRRHDPSVGDEQVERRQLLAQRLGRVRHALEREHLHTHARNARARHARLDVGDRRRALGRVASGDRQRRLTLGKPAQPANT